MAKPRYKKEPHLDVGETLQSVAQTYVASYKTLIPASLLAFVVPWVGIVLGVFLVAEVSIALGILVLLVAVLGIVAAAVLYYAGTVELVARLEAGGKPMSAVEMLKSAADRFWQVLGAGVVYVLSIFVGWAVASVFFSLVTPAVVLNRDRKAMASFGISARLVAGNAWRVFWSYFVLMLVLNILGGFLSGIGNEVVGSSLQGIWSIVVVAPIWALFHPILYFRLRALPNAPKPR